MTHAMRPLRLDALRDLEPAIIAISNHQGIIQSMLDFDYLTGRSHPSVLAVIAGGRRMNRYFFGDKEIALPFYPTFEALPAGLKKRANLFLNVGSGRRVLESSRAAMEQLPGLVGGTIFGEGIPERHALELAAVAQEHGVWIMGGASVGLVIPGAFKLGAIGGTQADQLAASRLFTPGHVAVVSTSGGMINELIRTVATTGHTVAFAAALGGERFPITTPQAALLAAQADPATSSIVNFGELGGRDEYLLAELLESGHITKPVVTYIAGTVAELFETPPQFGHAKAIAKQIDESARAKADALEAAGARVGRTYAEFVELIRALPSTTNPKQETTTMTDLNGRRRALIASSLSGDDAAGNVKILATDQLELATHRSFANIAISMFLGRPITSPELEQFTDFVLRLLVDNGPYVSGALNTITAARAGKDLVSSLAAGLLTVGPRFGGAINQAAATWLEAAQSGTSAAELVEEYARTKRKIAGIGHRKYRIDMPDPRVAPLLEFSARLPRRQYTQFALDVQATTTHKKGNLILNVDGAIAAVLLDLLAEKEGYKPAELKALVDTEFFNALFILSRSVGFMAHYFDQARLDEGLLRLGPDDVAQVDLPGL
jgi:ATP citrate (pro-S)-lyase